MVMLNSKLCAIICLSAVLALIPSAESAALQRGEQSQSSLNQRLRQAVRHTQYLRIYGNGSLWAANTKGTNSSQLAGLVVRDPHLINALLGNFLCESKAIDPSWAYDIPAPESNMIHIDFMGPHGEFDFLTISIDYIRHGKRAYDIEDIGNGLLVPLKLGSGVRFEAFIRLLADKARKHQTGVTEQVFETS